MQTCKNIELLTSICLVIVRVEDTFMSTWQLANFLGEPPKYMLTLNSDYLPINYFFYVLKMIVDMLDNF